MRPDAWGEFMGRLDDAQWAQENAQHFRCYVIDRVSRWVFAAIPRVAS